jgi:hypothetical protein
MDQAAKNPEDFEQCSSYDRIVALTLLLKAELSAVTDRRDVIAMAQRGPRAAVCQLTYVGHTPFSTGLKNRSRS